MSAIPISHHIPQPRPPKGPPSKLYSISPLNASHPSMHPLRFIRTSQLNNFWIYCLKFEISSSKCREKQALFFYINIVIDRIIKDVSYVLFSIDYYTLTLNIILQSSIANKIDTHLELTFLYNLSYLFWDLGVERKSYSTAKVSGCIEGWNALRGDIEYVPVPLRIQQKRPKPHSG